MLQFDLLFAWIGQWAAFGNEVVGWAIKIDLYIAGKPVIAAVVQKHAKGDPRCGLGAGPDVERGSRHSRNAKPFGDKVTLPHNRNFPRPTVDLQLFLDDHVHTLWVHTSIFPDFIIVVTPPPTPGRLGGRVV